MVRSKQSANPFVSEIQAVSNEYASPVRVFVVSDAEGRTMVVTGQAVWIKSSFSKDFLLERNYLFEKIYTSVKSKYDDITV
jgi:hypothetical protein